MLNERVTTAAISKRRADQLFFAVVSECFIDALPLDKSTMTSDELKGLQKYTWNVLESIGGINALESAYDAKNKTFDQNVYLAQIYQLCMESAHAANDDISKQIKNDPTLDMSQLVDKTALTKPEYAVFVNKKEALNLDKVADVIKQKTLKVIQDEKEQYEKEEELDKELNDALNDKKDEEFDPKKDAVDQNELKKASNSPNLHIGIQAPDQNIPKDDDNSENEKQIEENEDGTFTEQEEEKATNEAYLNMILEKDAPRHHVTVFSRLQQTAMEAMNYMKVENDEDYFPIVNKVTFEGLLRDETLPNIEAVTESLRQSATEEVTEVSEENRGKVATLVSIIVYTMMETLKTMGIFCPCMNTIQRFVRSPQTTTDMKVADAQEALNSANVVINEVSSVDLSKKSSDYLSGKVSDLKEVMEMTQLGLSNDPANESLISVASEAQKYSEEITNILKQRNDDYKISRDKSAMEAASYRSRIQMENDVAQFNKINSMFGTNPLVDEIQIGVNPGMVASVLNVKCLSPNHQVVRESFMDMQYPCEESTYLKYLTDTFHKSKMDGTSKKVSLLVNDGRGTRVHLN